MKKTSAKFRNLKQCLCWACCSAGLKSESSSSHDLSGWLSSLTTLQSVPGQLGAGLPKHSLPRDSSSLLHLVPFYPQACLELLRGQHSNPLCRHVQGLTSWELKLSWHCFHNISWTITSRKGCLASRRLCHFKVTLPRGWICRGVQGCGLFKKLFLHSIKDNVVFLRYWCAF